jgi:hypothetical protein
MRREMSRVTFAVAALLLAAAARAGAQANARIVVTPANPTMVAGDSLRLRAQVVDASGRPVAVDAVSFQLAGGRFEGEVDPDGLVRSGSTGTLVVTVAALRSGQGPMVDSVRVRMVPGPAATVKFAHTPKRLIVGQQMALDAAAYSAANDKRSDLIAWQSSAPNVVRVSGDGRITGVAPGTATITASTGAARASLTLAVVSANLSAFDIAPGTHEARTGDVVRFTAQVRDAGGRAIADLEPNWSIAPGHGVIDQAGTFVGYEAGRYTITATLGNRVAQATVTLTPRDARRPAIVVGRLPRTRFSTEEVWLHPNGKNAYLGSGRGGDVLYALDISDPSNPIVTDSVIANTRRVNDVMTTPDGKYLVFTREGASDRRNGIVICSLDDPAHPRPIAEFTDGVTAGVHSAFIYQQEKFGTHIYLTNDGTGALHIIDINDPYHPREVARWKTPRADAGRSLHDIDLRDGLLYASYWNDGLVILDIGNGMKGGTPSNPQFVSQYKYDLNDLYRQVEAAGGPGFIRGTHTAWRHRNYVFIADEVFPASGVQGAKDASAGRAYGRLQVLDVSDILNPKSVAFYEPEFGGVHNVWVAGDTLYMGAYNAGFRAFDISGELRGDLRAQQREMVHVNTADMTGNVANTAMTWGVVVRDGLAYVNDMNNGLWIVRIGPLPKSVIAQ